MKIIKFKNIIYKIGKNSYENWDILKSSQNGYIFFHLKSFPSCYVIMESYTTDSEYINVGAKLCKENTKYKNLNNIIVDYCNVSNTRIGDKVGEVYYISNRKVNQIKL